MTDQQQSPINLQNAIYADFGSEGLSIHWDGDILGHVRKDEHGVKVEFASDVRQYITIGSKRFHLRQFHFHHPSEHWVDGEQYTMELHLVHQNVDDGSLAVVGVFIEPGNARAAFPSLMTQIETVLGAGSHEELEPKVLTDPWNFLPKTWEQHFRYQGSLTTDPFTESVSWVVLKDPTLMPTKKLMELLELFQSEARFPQPLNRRYILKTFDATKPSKRKK
ncbi:carbonic anhydrase family protein [Stieleria varia]|uniref:carbonic anhydrase family protein n=1 Tax=Stieleria varia TaxID=2528005 RepID=UPI00313E7E8B